MAYDYGGASDFHTMASAPATVEPITMSAWFNTDATELANIMGIATSGSGNHRYNMAIAADGTLQVVIRSGVAGSANTTNTYSTDTWHHGCAIFRGDTDRTIILDGDTANEGNDATSVAVAGVDHVAIGAQRDSGASAFDGTVSEVGIWTVGLTDSEAIALSNGYSPQLIRPDQLVFYAPLIRVTDDKITGTTLTDNGTPAVADHIGIIYPRRKWIQSVPAAAAGTTLLQMQMQSRRRGMMARAGGRMS